MAIGLDPNPREGGDLQAEGKKHKYNINDETEHMSRSMEHEEHAQELRAMAKAHRDNGSPLHLRVGNQLSKAARLHEELASIHDHASELIDTHLSEEERKQERAREEEGQRQAVSKDWSVRWYVAETQWKMEREVCERLSSAGIASLCPLVIEGKRTLPMFLCYVFLQAPRASVHGIKQILGLPTPLPEPVAERMISLSSVPSTIERVVEELLPIIGSTVKITGGPMQGLTGRVLKSNRVRVGLLLQVLGRDAEIQVPTQLVVAA